MPCRKTHFPTLDAGRIVLDKAAVILAGRGVGTAAGASLGLTPPFLIYGVNVNL